LQEVNANPAPTAKMINFFMVFWCGHIYYTYYAKHLKHNKSKSYDFNPIFKPTQNGNKFSF